MQGFPELLFILFNINVLFGVDMCGKRALYDISTYNVCKNLLFSAGAQVIIG